MIADDPTTPGGIEAKQVLDTFVRETDALVDLYVDGEVISTTGEHPFWVADKGWVEAKDLVVGSLLQTQDGRIVDVDKIEKREGKFEVYNFNVEGIPTYFVSEWGILVHNADYPSAAQEIHNNLPNSLRKEKTVATDGQIETISGYNPNLKPPNFSHVPATEVIRRGQQIGHEFPNLGSRDRGIPGQAKASHAEVQLIVGNPSANNIEIAPRAMCPSCQGFFQKEARAQNRSIRVIDTNGSKTFNPDGSVD